MITRWITDVIQQYETEETLIDIRDYSIPEFEKLFSIVSSDKPIQELDFNDKMVAPVLSMLMNSFMTVLIGLIMKLLMSIQTIIMTVFQWQLIRIQWSLI